MDTVHLGRSGARVSPLCLGTMNFGQHTGEEDCHAILDSALDAGINYIDTSNVYGARLGEGLTEQIIGRWFAKGARRRERTVLATKLYGRMGDWPNEMYLSAVAIRQQCDASLKRLRTDHIDVYQMHHIDRAAPWEELWEAFDTLKSQGKILYVGSSNFPGWGIARANERAERRHSFGLVSEQSLYNLMARTVELEVIPACEQYGVAFNPWSPLFGGLLSGVLRKQSPHRSTDERARRRLAKHRPAIEAYETFCDELGHAPSDVALAWLLAQPAVTAPIIGPRTVEQLAGAVRALDVKLDDSARARLDEIFPGPGGPAPEAYSW